MSTNQLELMREELEQQIASLTSDIISGNGDLEILTDSRNAAVNRLAAVNANI